MRFKITQRFSRGAGLIVALMATCVQADSPATTYELQAVRQAGAVMRVEALLEVGGDLKLPGDSANNLVPMSAVGKLTYDEKLLSAPVHAKGHLLAVRRYDQCEAELKIQNRKLQPKLRKDRRVVIAQTGPAPRVTLFCPDGPLSREELDLIDTPGNSLLVDGLLPDRVVAIGDEWSAAPEVLAPLLGLETISSTDVTCVLKEATAASAKMELSGHVYGALGGAASEMELKAKYKFDKNVGRVTWLALLIKERRAVGLAMPGVDVVARLQMKLTPVEQSASFDAIGSHDHIAAEPPLLDLTYEPSVSNFRLRHDRNWYVMDDESNRATLRRVDGGELIAQCNIQWHSNSEDHKEPSLARFQEEIERALGESFGAIVEASQTTNDTAQKVYRVVVSGQAGDLPVRWHYYLVVDGEKSRLVLAFAMEEKQLERFADADRAIVSSVEFVDHRGVSTGQPTPAATPR